MPGLPVKFLSFLFLACAPQPAQAQSYVRDDMTFHGYACSADCSEHEAGYKWAMERNIVLADDCSNSSSAFMEGCFAWVEEQLGEAPVEAVEPPANGYYE